MDDDYLDSDFKNFMSICIGLSYIGKLLEPYTRSGLKNVYQTIYTNLAGFKPCSEMCSSTHRQHSKWCSTCSNWKDQLQRSMKKQCKHWASMKSWDWPTDYECIIGVFLPKEWSNIDINLQDISTSCNIWECCSEFKIQPRTTDRLKKMRNKHYGHNPKCRVKENEKVEVFDALKDLITDNHVKGHVNIGETLQKLNKIEQGDQVQQYLENIKSDITAVKRQMLHRDVFEKKMAEIMRMVDAKKEKKNEKLLLYSIALIPVILSCILYWVHCMYSRDFGGYHNTTLSSGSNCLSEKYTFPFRQDMELFGYIRNDQNLIGREWLFDDLENKLLNTRFSKAGIIAIAEIGYGKSAIVSHLLCASNDEKGGKLREHTVAFHICKFDVPSTHRPERFVRRLIGFLSSKSAEFGNIISMLDNSSIIFNLEQCGQEIEACFDQGVVLPFQKVKEMPGVPWIIVIDAIDECLNTKENKNAILELLSSRARKLPKWIKLLITSRNITQLAHLNKITRMSLKSNDQNNIKDVTLYIENMFSQKGAELSSGTISERIDQIVHKSEGNFMYIRHAIDYLMQKNENETSSLELPSSLGEIYELNFERQFDTTSSFQCPKAILEIICASLDPLRKNDIFKILSVNNVTYVNDFNTSFDKLSHFVHSDNALVALVHQSLYEWLISEENEVFHISVERGHNLISKYLFSTANINQRNDIVSLAIHVAKSKDSSLSKMFTSMKNSQYNLHYNDTVIHRLIWATNSVTALDLVLHFTHNVDALSRGGVTPAFIAASKGHIGQLKLLSEKGSNMSFIIDPVPYAATDRFFLEIPEKILIYLSGYGLLHIAAKNGHSEVVEYLLNWKKSLLDIKDSIGLRASDIACENGHKVVLGIIARFNPKVYDDICLFHAAKSDSIYIIDKLISVGVKADCITDERSISKMKDVLDIDGRVFIDSEFWVVFKETALHAAVKAGNIAIVKRMIKHLPSMLVCKDAFGRTPFLTSVVYNQTYIFQLMLDTSSKDECGPIPTHIERDHKSNHISEYIFKNACPYGAKFTHLIALYNRNEMLFYIYTKCISVDWNEQDKNNMSPIHYAVRKSNICFLEQAVGSSNTCININITTRTNLGISVYHLAAMYSPISLSVLTENLQLHIPELNDLTNTGILHYLVMNQLNGLTYEHDSNEHSMDVILFKYLVDVCKHNITTTDALGLNILHYAMFNGHSGIIEYIWQTYKSDFISMIQATNFIGDTPVIFAIKGIDTTKHRELVLPDNCNFYDIFKKCNSSIYSLNVLTSFEYGLVFLLQQPQLTRSHSDIRRYFKNIIVSSPYVTTAALVHSKGFTRYRVYRHLLGSLKLNPSPYSLISIARYKPEVFRACGKPLSKSPLHIIALNVENQYNIFSTQKNDDECFLKFIFGARSNYSCGDENGLNIFHYALLGGNIHTAKMLLAHGIEVTNQFISTKDILILALFGRRVYDRTNYFNKDCFNRAVTDLSELNHLTKLDSFLTEFILSHKHNLKPGNLCKPKSKDLSVVHLLAVNGMLNALKTIADHFGLSTVLCENVDRFTPLYFAKFFNHLKIVKYLEAETSTLPRVQAELHFFYKILFNLFPSKNISDPLYCLKRSKIKHANWNIREQRKLFNCVRTFFLLSSTDMCMESELKSTLRLATAFVDSLSFLGNVIQKTSISEKEDAHFTFVVDNLLRSFL